MDAPGASRTRLIMIAVILLVATAVYGNTLLNGFVYDDEHQILNNPWIRDFGYLPHVFASNVWEFMGNVTNYYRPLMHTIYMIEYHLFGLTPWGFHLVNILLNSGISVLVFLIVARLLRQAVPSASASSLFPPFAAALLFATHPIHTEVVAWIAGVPELAFTFFYLVSFYLFVLAEERMTWRHVLSAGSFFLATLCKETALTLPIILIVYDLTLRPAKSSLRECLRRYVPYVVVVVGYFILRVNALKGFAPVSAHKELGNSQYVANVFPVFAAYLEKLLVPVNLNAFHILHPLRSIFEGRGLFALAVTVAFVTASGAAFRKSRVLFFGCVLIVVPLLPALYIPGLGENTFAERYLYLPSLGFVLMAAWCITLAVRNPGGVVAAAVTVVLVAGGYATGTVFRNAVWRDNYALWSDTVKKSPDGAVPHYNYGNSLIPLGRLDEAIEQYKISIAIKPSADACYNLGRTYDRKGLPGQAVEQYRQAVALRPDDADSYNHLGFDYVLLGQVDEGIRNLEIAVSLKPFDQSARGNLAYAYSMKAASGRAAR